MARVHSTGSQPPTEASIRHPSYFISKLHGRSVLSGSVLAVASMGAIRRIRPIKPVTWPKTVRLFRNSGDVVRHSHVSCAR